jgi:hypothetical protein
MRLDAEKRVFDAMALDAEILTSGCCGMAGAFGYEKGTRHEVSMAAGERVLLPAVRRAPSETLILADGFSCKEQIAQSTNRRALHLAEAMNMAIEHGPEGLAGPYPERSTAHARAAAQRRSMRRAALSLFAISAAGIGLVAWRTSRRRALRLPRVLRWG